MEKFQYNHFIDPFLPEACFGLRVLSLPAPVPVSLYPCQPRASPRDNLSPVQARITEFGPEVQNTLVKIPIVFRVCCFDLQVQI